MSTPVTLPNGVRQSGIMKIGLPLCYRNPQLNLRDGSNVRFLEVKRGRSADGFLIIQTGEFCEEMLAKLKKEPNIWANHFLASPRGKGPRSEVREFFAIIRELSITPNTHPRLQVIICSNKGNFLRVKMHVNTYNLERWDVEYRTADHSFEWHEALREIKDLFVDVIEDILSNITSRWRKWIASKQPAQVSNTETA